METFSCLHRDGERERDTDVAHAGSTTHTHFQFSTPMHTHTHTLIQSSSTHTRTHIDFPRTLGPWCRQLRVHSPCCCCCCRWCCCVDRQPLLPPLTLPLSTPNFFQALCRGCYCCCCCCCCTSTNASTPNPATGNNNPAWFATDADRLLRFKFMIPGKFMSLLFYFYAPLFLSFSWTKRFIEREKCGVPFLSWIKSHNLKSVVAPCLENTSSRLAQLELIVSLSCCVKFAHRLQIKLESSNGLAIAIGSCFLCFIIETCAEIRHRYKVLSFPFFFLILTRLWSFFLHYATWQLTWDYGSQTYNMIQFLVHGSCGNIA